MDDRRGRRVSRAVGLGGAGGLGILVVVLLALFFGVDPTPLLQGMQGSGGTGSVGVGTGGGGTVSTSPEEDEKAQFVSVVLADTEDVWNEIFSREGLRYEEPTLVLFTDAVRSACGMAQAASGPFYCPGDHKLYIDLGFYEELRDRFRAPGDFAQAYVIAHEVGHHLQTLLGISRRVHELRGRVGQAEYNRESVKLELQADCLAGVWAHHAQRSKQILEPGDIEEALGAASAIGDDRIQRQTRGQVVPDSFTHGTSEQRVRWFRTGFESGDPDACDTFAASSL